MKGSPVFSRFVLLLYGMVAGTIIVFAIQERAASFMMAYLILLGVAFLVFGSAEIWLMRGRSRKRGDGDLSSDSEADDPSVDG